MIYLSAERAATQPFAAETTTCLTSVHVISPAANTPVLSEPHLKILLGQSVTAIEGNEVVERIKMSDANKKETSLEVSGVFVCLHGNKPIVDFLG
ncbi:hypothetical protein HKBW3S03_01886, partial [Candidatus Hakubella thermalkaliphila]